MDVVTEKLFECNEQILKARQQLEFQEKITLSLKDERDKAQEKYAQFQSVEAMKVGPIFEISQCHAGSIHVFFPIQIVGRKQGPEMPNGLA